MKIGIRAHDLGKHSAERLSKLVLDNNFDGVQLVFPKAIESAVDFNNLSNIKDYFGDTPEIFMLGAYFNPVHPDKSVVENGIKNFKKHLEISKELNAKYVGSESGSLMGSPWGYMPENHSQECLDTVVDIFSDLAKHAEKHEAKIALEGAWAHVLGTPLRVLEVVNKINSPALKVTIDLYNFLNIDNYENRMDILDESIELLNDNIVIFHLKDFIVQDNKLIQVGLGQGLMDYPEIIKKIKVSHPNAFLIFEGVTGGDIVTSYELINELLGR